MKKVISFVTLITLTLKVSAQGPYAPAAGQAGSSAIHKDSTCFISWATGCTLNRGFQDISTPSLGNTNVGTSNSPLGKSGTNGVVSLGDGGSAILTFGSPIINGPGADFAIFENSFSDTFLELAFVEVSSDGINFFRFDAISLTDTSTQTPGFGTSDPTEIYNLAGKYRAQYGTPFDLDELSSNAGLDINNITHIKVIDVIGSINPLYASYDSQNRAVNDPWPTGFGSSGFDLDAIGVIHSISNSIENRKTKLLYTLYPNPVKDILTINVNISEEYNYEILNTSGTTILSHQSINKTEQLDLSELASGIYFLRVSSEKNVEIKKIVKH